jgi:hypothetical protein
VFVLLLLHRGDLVRTLRPSRHRSVEFTELDVWDLAIILCIVRKQSQFADSAIEEEAQITTLMHNFGNDKPL